MACLDGHACLARDGTGDCAAQTMPCPSCLHQGHRHGSVPAAPQRWGARIPPGRAVMPPEAGAEGATGGHKHKGWRTERRHALWRHAAPDHPPLQCLVPVDRLSTHAPQVRETLPDHALHAILGGQEGYQAFWVQQVRVPEHAGRVTVMHDTARAAGVSQRLRCMRCSARPPRRTDGALFCGGRGEERCPGAACRWVTDGRGSTRHVYALRRGGRARWKIAHEPCNPLQTQGEHGTHHDGHGTQNLAVVFAMGMLLAFCVEQAQPLGCALGRAVWTPRGRKRLLGERMRALLYA